MREFSIAKYMFYCGLDKDDYNKVRGEIASRNRKNIILYSSIAAFFMGALFLASYIPEAQLSVNRELYFSFFLIDVAIYFAANRFVKNEAQILTHTYFFICSFYTFGIIMGTLLDGNSRAVTCIVMLFAGPILFTDIPARMCSILRGAVVLFLALVIRFKNPSIWRADFVNAICYGLFSIVTTIYLSRVKAERYLYEIKAEEIYEHDILTGVRNRNSYETNIQSLFDSCEKRIIIVYFDVNGLHEVNNSQGHRAGDIMLKVCAQHIRDVFGKDYTFRIGGDEFLGIAFDKTDTEIDSMLEIIFDGTRRESYHVSTGYAHCYKDGGNISDSLKEAEQFMFKNKAAYYTSIGKDRRNR